jgi:hypothetical protein
MLAHTHTHNLSASWDKQQGITPLCIKRKEMDPQKMINGTTQGSNKTKSQPLGVKKYFVKDMPTQMAIGGLIATTYSFWYPSLEESGAQIKQPTTCCGTYNYITLHYILLCGNLAVHFQLGMTPCSCVRMGYLLTYAALDITNKKLTK